MKKYFLILIVIIFSSPVIFTFLLQATASQQPAQSEKKPDKGKENDQENSQNVTIELKENDLELKQDHSVTYIEIPPLEITLKNNNILDLGMVLKSFSREKIPEQTIDNIHKKIKDIILQQHINTLKDTYITYRLKEKILIFIQQFHPEIEVYDIIFKNILLK